MYVVLDVAPHFNNSKLNLEQLLKKMKSAYNNVLTFQQYQKIINLIVFNIFTKKILT